MLRHLDPKELRLVVVEHVGENNSRERFPLVIEVALYRLDQVGNEVVAAPELDVDLGVGVLVPILKLDERVLLANDVPSDQQNRQEEYPEYDKGSPHRQRVVLLAGNDDGRFQDILDTVQSTHYTEIRKVELPIQSHCGLCDLKLSSSKAAFRCAPVPTRPFGRAFLAGSVIGSTSNRGRPSRSATLIRKTILFTAATLTGRRSLSFLPRDRPVSRTGENGPDGGSRLQIGNGRSGTVSVPEENGTDG